MMNWELIVSVLVVLAGVGVFIVRAYKEGTLKSALLMVLRELVDWAQDQLQNVTEDEVRIVARSVYRLVIAGTFLAKLVGEVKFTELAWDLWQRYVREKKRTTSMLTNMPMK